MDRCQMPPAQRSRSPGAAPAGSDRAAEHTVPVYLIEDSPLIRENLIAALEEMAPVTVVGCADTEGAATRWLAAHERADQCRLVIVDIFLKAGSGLGVLRAMADPSGARKVVVLSNYATPEMRQRCIELGADQVFDKSDDIDELVGYCEDLARAA